ncbi:MAG: hypothetical protein WBF90_15265 [Rivularia sp. (in: cyanobacteria)]
MIATNSNSNHVSHPADKVLEISPPKFEIDDYALRALEETEQFYKTKYFGSPDNPINAKEYLVREGLLGRIAELSRRLNSTGGIKDAIRLLLSNSTIYASLIKKALTEDNVQNDDSAGLYSSVIRSIEQLPRRYFLAQVVNKVISAKRVRLKESSKQWQRLDDLTLERGIPIRKGQVEPAVMDILSTLYKEGDLPYYINEYINRGIIAKSAFTPSVKQAMINYLVKLGVEVKSAENFQEGLYDDYFVLAYNEARKQSTDSDDPLDTARNRGSEISWDFTVDTFESIEEQGVLPSNIKAAGALDYIYQIGDRMQVYNVANALVLRWASGILDVTEGKTGTELYRFHKRRSERSTAEERGMLYKRVLNKGNGRLLSNMIPNEAFAGYWHALMSEVAEYIRKSESGNTSQIHLSRAPLYQATKNLQYNLTEFMTGMAHRQVHEDYAHLQDALNIIKSEEIVNHFGGRRKSMWNVIEQVAKEDLSMNLQVAALRTLAVEGNKVFQWIANFSEGTVREDEFRAFLTAGEAWILAQAAISDDDFDSDDSYMDDEDDDDFDDWEM